jgi:hypothetical protein
MRTHTWPLALGSAIGLLVGIFFSLEDLVRSAQADEITAPSTIGTAPSSLEDERARHFDAHIAPLLARHCFECHDSTSRKGRLDLSRKDTALAPRKSGKTIVPGNAAESLLWQSVESNEMPEERPPLSPEEKQLLREWIDAGAVWSGNEIDPLAFTRDRRAAYNWVRRLTVPEYIETIRSAVGVDVSVEARRILPLDLRADGFYNTAYNLSIDLSHIEAYAELARIIVSRMDVPAFASSYATCKELNESCMREIISGMGKWLLRGPLEEHEVAAFLRVSHVVADEGGTFVEAVSFVLEAMLQSPRFIYRIEKQVGDGKPRLLGNYELASRLSYILWGAPPDKELMRAADAGELSDPKRVEAQVRRMLKDPRAVEQSSRFIQEWLDLDRLNNLRPNRTRFPKWDDQLAIDMREETLAFFKEVVWNQKRPLSELMNAQVTFATPRLADFYGLPRKENPASAGQASAAGDRVKVGLQALYTFEERGGNMVRDLSGAGEPMHLKIAEVSAVLWTEQGLTVNSPTLIQSERPARKLIEAVKKSNAITLEAWVTPANATQSGPARVLTLSSGAGQRNFTLGQDGGKFEVRFRRTGSNPNGQPGLDSPAGSAQARLAHLVYTRDAAGKAKLYIDGEEKVARDLPGDLSNWDNQFEFMLANESSKDRPWRGTWHLVAVYDRALSVEEVRRNHAAGARQQRQPVLAGAISGERIQDLQALYRFDEKTGDTIRDSSKAGEPLDLKIENTSAVAWGDRQLAVNAPALITSAQPPARWIAAVKKSKAFTLEAWITPANASQSGPARILTLSSGISQRNFTLGQEGDKFEVRLRASGTDLNGTPGLSTPSGSVQARLTHVVFTREASGKERFYIDGQERASRDGRGDFSNWDEGFRLMLGNESSKDRPWRGTFHLLAIYSRALSPEEIQLKGGGVSRYDLSSVPARGGLLTHGSVLTVGGDEASMVTRGLFILHDFLYSAVGSAPPGTDTTPLPTKPGVSQRGAAEIRLGDRSCAGCHSKFEPFAFGLERFDGVGAYHEVDEHGNKLREDGEILLPGEEKPVAFKSSAELMELLAGSERVRRNFTRKVTQFALGRPLVESDARVIDGIHESGQKNGGTYASLITAIALSDLVRMTGTERGQ